MDEQNQGTATGSEQAVDDRGTDQQTAHTILQQLRDQGFEASDEKLAVALGRPVEEITKLMGGSEPVDDDIVMKARGIALQRGITIE